MEFDIQLLLVTAFFFSSTAKVGGLQCNITIIIMIYCVLSFVFIQVPVWTAGTEVVGRFQFRARTREVSP